MSRSLAVLCAFLILHAVLVPWSGPWWIPNFTLVGLILAVARSPRWWLPLSGLAGLCMLIWSVRFPRTILLAYLMLGWLIRWLAGRWDVTDARVQSLLAMAACGLLTGGALWLEGFWSWSLLGAAAVQVILTGVTIHAVRRAG